MPVCDQWTPCLHMNTYAVTRIYPPPFTPSPPTPHSWLLCCCHGDTKPCTLKSALRRSRGETDNNIPISRQTDTHTSAQTLVFVEVIITRFGGAGVCVCVCVCRPMFVCFYGRWVFRCPLPVHVQTDCEWRNRATWSDETSGENLLCSQHVVLFQGFMRLI